MRQTVVLWALSGRLDSRPGYDASYAPHFSHFPSFKNKFPTLPPLPVPESVVKYAERRSGHFFSHFSTLNDDATRNDAKLLTQRMRDACRLLISYSGCRKSAVLRFIRRGLTSVASVIVLCFCSVWTYPLRVLEGLRSNAI